MDSEKSAVGSGTCTRDEKSRDLFFPDQSRYYRIAVSYTHLRAHETPEQDPRPFGGKKVFDSGRRVPHQPEVRCVETVRQEVQVRNLAKGILDRLLVAGERTVARGK